MVRTYQTRAMLLDTAIISGTEIGLWQINGRKATTLDERIQLDLRYVHNWSIGLDLGIIIKTIKVVLSGHGSY